MTVQDLINELEDIEDKSQMMIMSVDGNYYDPIDQVETGYRYHDEYREVGLIELTPELEKHGYTDEDLMEDQINTSDCVILYS